MILNKVCVFWGEKDLRRKRGNAATPVDGIAYLHLNIPWINDRGRQPQLTWIIAAVEQY